jgi:hypothetical protein
MRLVVSEAAAELIDERGGRLYVWVKKGRCCGGLKTLATSHQPPEQHEFRRIENAERFELLLPATLSPLPAELHIDVQRFPRRVEAYWGSPRPRLSFMPSRSRCKLPPASRARHHERIAAQTLGVTTEGRVSGLSSSGRWM